MLSTYTYIIKYLGANRRIVVAWSVYCSVSGAHTRARTLVEIGSTMAQPTPPAPGARLLSFALLSATLVTGTLVDDTKQASRRADGSTALLASLRRQLMVNNYDYMSSEPDEFPALHEQEVPRAAPYPPAAPASAPDEGATPTPLPFVNEIHISRAAEPEFLLDSGHAEDGAGAPRALAKNDLLYYMDDEMLSRRAGAGAPAALRHPHELAGDTTPKLKYKVLKMKEPPPGGARRSGHRAAYRRFVQEEGEGGVAIINLGDEPFPEFRLPSARRQYMSDEAAARSGSDIKLALPSDLEPDTRPPQN